MAGILSKIVQHKKKEVEKRKQELPLEKLLEQLVSTPSPTRPFKDFLLRSRKLALIAELKKASPSKGLLVKSWDARKIATTYQDHGATALSVVTDEKFFQGRGETIAEVKKACSLPVLRKDFIVDPHQVYESRLLKADAVLLIAALFQQPKDLKRMVQLALNLSMTPLVEVHTAAELQKAVKSEAEFIGINNRDLATFKVDLKTTLKLIKKVPRDRFVVSESGIHGADDARMLWEAGVKAILVGEALLKAKPMGPLVEELSKVEDGPA